MILNNELIAHQKRARAYLNDAHTQPTLTERSERIIKGLNSQRKRRSDGWHHSAINGHSMLDYCSTSGAYAVCYVYQAAITLLLLAGLGKKKCSITALNLRHCSFP